jgi:hypothetical protein
MFNTVGSGLVVPDCEVMVDTGNLRCDLYLPVREILKLRLTPTDITKQAKPIDTKAITIRQFEQVEITMSFADADGKKYPRKALLEVFGNDAQYQELKDKAAAVGSSPSSVESATDSSTSPLYESPQLRAAVRPPINQLTPIKHLGGSGKERVILGKSGMMKLSLKYDAETNAISLLDEPEWEL